MHSVPVLPESAPFTAEQRAWLNGFLAGVFSRQPGAAASAAPAAALTPLTIVYASQTGTTESLAKKAAKEAGKRGFAPAILDVASVSAESLQSHSNLLLISSTYGDGEPPDSAKALHAALRDGAHALASVRFSVCAIGDTNYTLFCQAGKDFDAYLEKHGAKRVHARVDCDTDYETSFDTWLNAALGAFGSAAPASSPSALQVSDLSLQPSETGYSKNKPFFAPVLTVRNLNAAGSAKEVNHVEFDLAGSGLVYEAGDALGVVPQNDPALVADVLAVLGADGEEAVSTKAGEFPLRRALTEHLDLGKPSPALLELLGLAAATPPPHHVIDALHAAKIINDKSLIINPQAFAAALKPIAARLYSISSSPKAHAGQVHLTVGAVRYELGGRARKGICSTFLAERALALGKVGVFVHSNKAFRPPSDPALPVIMVGPGTGIAPFRAFLHERAATQAAGKNWLFFGDQKASTDFLYHDELSALRGSGVLTRLDVAFSRDQKEKIYVQNRMEENASELWAWLEQGAHFYVCGDASRMAKDVDAALHKVVEIAGGKSTAEAAAYVQALKTAKRYQRDVY